MVRVGRSSRGGCRSRCQVIVVARSWLHLCRNPTGSFPAPPRPPRWCHASPSRRQVVVTRSRWLLRRHLHESPLLMAISSLFSSLHESPYLIPLSSSLCFLRALPLCSVLLISSQGYVRKVIPMVQCMLTTARRSIQYRSTSSSPVRD
uniref:Uncharacterized protein n=1 Tax=Oryza rufipogon TaxID=4529 RepID=A0A0E0QY06_ORYRU